MKLYCIRHGEAEMSLETGEPALTERGLQEIEKVSGFLAKRGLAAHHIFSSKKLRAKQTAQVFASALQITHINESDTLLSPDSEVALLLEMIYLWQEDTLLVGHLPFISKLISALVIEEENKFPIVNCPPGTVVCLERYEPHRFIINWVLCPAMIPGDT